MEAWESLVGTAFTNAFGNATASFALGIFLLLALIWYCFAFGLSSEVILIAGGILFFYLSFWGILPQAGLIIIPILGGLWIYKAVSQVPNG